jgi:hypothetical protein
MKEFKLGKLPLPLLADLLEKNIKITKIFE